jgi:uncharacterized secreted protein with C-terminal beta-propeller domain
VAPRRALALVALTAGALAGLTPAADAKRRADLKEFPSCGGFVHYARGHALRELRTMGSPGVMPIGMPIRTDGQAPPQAKLPASGGGSAPDYSGTNVQEAGVDEPDIVKTDGKTIFTIENGRLIAVDARSDTPVILGSLVLDSFGGELLLDGNRLLVLSSSGYSTTFSDVVAPSPAARKAAPAYYVPASTLTEIDVSDPAAMKVVKTMSVDGSYVSARLNGHTARVVFSAIPQAIPMLAASPAKAAARKARIGRTTTKSWRPSYRLRSGAKGRVSRHALVRCTDIARPVQFSGLNSLTILTIDLTKGLEPVDSDAIMTDGQIVYGSQNSLYVATEKAIVEKPAADAPPPDQVTEIHKFDISKPDQTTFVGSGAVTGTLLNQFSMSEKDGNLRVASTTAPLWWAPGADRASESGVTVLAERGGALAEVGRLTGLGKGERIYAVRFIDDVGYVVTFRQVDPLFTIGLSDPAHPRLLGSLDLLGYSAYLHPVGDGLLLGVGQAANDQGRTEGTQLSLFDVSDPANPARIAQYKVGSSSSSTAEFDHHAFLWWAPAKLAVLPLQLSDYEPSSGRTYQFSGALGFHVAKGDPISEAGRVWHPADNGYSPPIDRSLIVGDRLFTISTAGIKSSDLASFADRGFAAFPQPQPPASPPGPATQAPAK